MIIYLLFIVMLLCVGVVFLSGSQEALIPMWIAYALMVLIYLMEI